MSNPFPSWLDRAARLAPLAALLWLALPAAAAPSFSVLTYNVAGLPNGLSSSTPEVNNALISPRLNPFDLVLVQEDFGFHEDLISQLTHPDLSIKDDSDRPPANFGIGDGLNRFSRSPFTEHRRETWLDCFGLLTNASDCLAPKGFSMARHQWAPGQSVDVYNFHAEAGGADEDKAARASNLRQLASAIEAWSADRAVLLLGDSNSRYTRDGDILPELLEATGLKDVWVELVRGGAAPEVGPRVNQCVLDGLSGPDCEVIDRVFWRSSNSLRLTPLSYEVLDADFLDADGVPLSDHDPVLVVFELEALPAPGSLLLGALSLVVLGLRGHRSALL